MYMMYCTLLSVHTGHVSSLAQYLFTEPEGCLSLRHIFWTFWISTIDMNGPVVMIIVMIMFYHVDAAHPAD